MKTETKRVTVYDWLRLIATIWVVLGHSGYIVNDSLCGGVNYSLPDSPLAYSTWARALATLIDEPTSLPILISDTSTESTS